MAKAIIYHVIVVGCGGTGSFFIKEFGRFMARSRERILLTLIDGDTVESHNLDRQSFQEEDVGLPKSTIMAESLCSCLGIPEDRVTSYPVYIDSASQFSALVQNSYGAGVGSFGSIYYGDRIHFPIIIGCVDNHAARKVLHEYYTKYLRGHACYFDSANEFANGEVVFSAKTDKEMLAPPRGDLFPDVLDSEGKSRTQMSCAELNVHEPQHIVTNMLAANLLLAKTCQLIGEQTMPELGVAIFHSLSCICNFHKYQKPVQYQEENVQPEKREVKKRARKKKEIAAVAS